MILTCKNTRCGYTWDYKGTAAFYATCPRCHYNVNVRLNTVVSVVGAPIPPKYPKIKV